MKHGCAYCGKVFNRKSKVGTHFKVVHKINMKNLRLAKIKNLSEFMRKVNPTGKRIKKRLGRPRRK